MPIATFLARIEQHLKSGIATEHTYRPDLRDLFDAVLKPATATNEPKHERYGAPDLVTQQGNAPVGHVEAKDIGIDMTQGGPSASLLCCVIPRSCTDGGAPYAYLIVERASRRVGCARIMLNPTLRRHHKHLYNSTLNLTPSRLNLARC